MTATPSYPPGAPSPNASATATPTAPPGDLAATGGPDWLLAVLLVGVLLIAAGLVAAARQRSR